LLSKDVAIDFLAVVPHQMHAMLQDVDTLIRLHKAHAVIVGGGATEGTLEDKCERIQAPTFSTFGMTETVSHIALRRLNGRERSSVYSLLPNVEAGIDQRGCLWVCGAVTNHKTVQTNDLVRFHGEAAFEWLGRVDHVINSGGIKIFPEQLERTLQPLLPGWGVHNDFFLTGLPHDTLGQQTALVVEGTLPVSHQSVLEHCRLALPDRQAPRCIVELPQFTRTNGGKIRRRETLGSGSAD
jgi:O-succinylbenzoic acid--CoA ligase